MGTKWMRRGSLGRAHWLGLGCLLLLVSFAVPSQRQSKAEGTTYVAPIPGNLLLAGRGDLGDSVLISFMKLSGGSRARIVVVSSGEPGAQPKRWEKLGATRVEVLRLESSEDLHATSSLSLMMNAEGLWIEEVEEALWEDELFAVLIQNSLARNGAVAGVGATALKLASSSLDSEGKRSEPTSAVLPGSIVHLASKKAGEDQLRKALEDAPGHVGWMIPDSTAMLVYHGRRICAVGDGELTALVVPKNDWPERVERVEAKSSFQIGDNFRYSLDLLAWRRSALDHLGPVFPPLKAPVPKLAKGTLIMHGGGGVNDAVFERFIKEAGGKSAPIVCIPSADNFAVGDSPDSYSADELRERGCKNVTILHTTSSETADLDEDFLEPLSKAKGVWIDGGRTYRVIDSFHGTKAHELMFDVLKRGGVVAGSSAGGQVVGDFLVRGNPRTNEDLVHEGYTRGLGFIEGVIIDAHFSQRDRGGPFAEMLKDYPQMLGIGLDAEAALVVQGSVGEVLGENRVIFYDLTNKKKSGQVIELEVGESYDLKKRAKRR